MLVFIYFSYGVLALTLFNSLIEFNLKEQSFLFTLILILISFLFLTTWWREWSESRQFHTNRSLKKTSFDPMIIVSILTGTVISFNINHSLGMGSVIGASFVGLVGSLFFKKYSASIYCGGFVGMACSILFANPFSLLTAALVSVIMLILSQSVLEGFGGKLGFIAFGGCYIASILFQTPFRIIPAISSELYPIIFIYIIGSGLATFTLQKEFKLDAVKASAIVGLSLALIHPDPSHTVVVAAYCASFAGMTSPKKVSNYTEMLLLTILTGILFIAASALFDGSGGRLGSIAFLSTVSGSSLIHFAKQANFYFSNKKPGKRTSRQY